MQPEKTERRKSSRHRVFLGGRIFVGSGNAQHYEISECVIRNIAVDGAAISVQVGDNLPDAFRFEIPAKNCTLRARTIWRRGDRAGLRFDGFDIGSRDSLPVEPSMGRDTWRN